MESLKKLILVLFPVLFFSQEIEPDFIQEIRKEVPNLRIADSLYNRYREKKEGKPQNYYTVYSKEKGFIDEWHSEFHHWRKEHLKYVGADGSVIIPSPDEIETSFNKVSRERVLSKKKQENLKRADNRKSAITAAGGTIWTYLGPKDQYTIDGEKVNTQVNVQAFDQSLKNRDILFCAPENGGIYKSTDRGVNWSIANLDYDINSCQFLKIHPDDDNKVIAATKEGIVYSTIDGGATWRVASLPSNLSVVSNYYVYDINTMEIIPASGVNPAKAFILGRKGMYSYDFDTNTITVASDFNIRGSEIKVSPSDPNTIYLLGLNETTLIEELHVSTDRGITWEKKASNGYITPPVGETSIVNSRGGRIGMTPADPNRIYVYLIGQYANVSGEGGGYITFMRSDDAGNTWRVTDPYGPGIGTVPYDLNNFKDAKPHVNLASSSGSTGFHQGYYNTGILVDQFDANKVIVGGVKYHKTTDGGLTFTLASDGALATNSRDLHSDFQLGLSNKYGTEQDNWICNDGGIGYSNNFFGEIAVDVVEKRSTNLPSEFWGFDVGLFYKNMTGGRYHNGDAAMVSAYNGDFIYVGGAETDTGLVLFGSEERDMMWRDATDRIIPSTIGGSDTERTISSTYYPGGHMFSYVRPMFDKTLTGTFYFGIGKKVIKYFQNKKGIELHEFENELIDVAACASDENYVYTMMQGIAGYANADRDAIHLFRSIDGGLNWEKIYEFPNTSTNWRGYNIFVDNNNPLRVWAHAKLRKGFYVSEDGGKTFTELASTPEDVYDMVYQWSSNNIYAATKGGVYRYDITNNTWHDYGQGVPAGLTPHRIQATYGEKKLILSSGGNGVWEADFYSESDAYPIYLTLDSGNIIGYNRGDIFNVTSSNYGDLSNKTVTWSTNATNGTITTLADGSRDIVFNSYGVFDVIMKAVDNTTGEINKVVKKFYVYPGCSFDGSENNILIPTDNILIWFDATGANKDGVNYYVRDKFGKEFYLVNTRCKYTQLTDFIKADYNNSGNSSLYFNGNYSCMLPFDRTYTEGKTFFWVLNQTDGTFSDNRYILGDITKNDFAGDGATKKQILASSRDFAFDYASLNGVKLARAFDGAKPTKPGVIALRNNGTDVVQFSSFSRDRSQYYSVWHGHLAELLIYERRLTDQEIQKVEQYLMKKYKITP